ncbi:MAG: dihydrolipoamide acetyltransferase family protein [Sphingomonadales bacterium]
MARYEFKLPDIGEGIAEAEIVAWHVKVGDRVEEDQQIADLMTDKATVEMESPVAGRVIALAGEAGEQIPIGSVLVVLETDAEAAADGEDKAAVSGGRVAPTEAAARAEPSPSVAAEERRSGDRRKGERRGADRRAPAAEGEGAPAEKAPAQRRILTSPAVRQRARDLGIDLAVVRSAGGDRIRHSDLDAYLLYHGGAADGRSAPPRADEQVKIVGLRRRIAENMQEAKRRIPHFSYVEEVDVTALEATRAMMNDDRGDNPKLTLLPFVITAICRAAAHHPQVNATFDDDAGVLTRHGAVHVGMATRTDAGLAVPVIRDAQARDAWGLAREILRLGEATRTGKAAREELSGSTITVSSLGPLGGIVSTPVVNRPEVAIVAVNRIVERPVVVDGRIEVRKTMNLSSSFDHRVVDGWDAATFIQEVKRLLEHPLLLLSLR